MLAAHGRGQLESEPHRRRRQNLVGDRPRRVGARQRSRGRAIVASAPSSPRRPPTSAAEPAGSSASSSTIVAAPAASIQARVGALVVGGRVGIRDQHRRAPGRGELEDRAARASQRPDRRRRGRRRGRARSRSTRSPRCAAPRRGALAAPRSRARPARWSTWKSRPSRSANASIAAKLTERAPWLPPMTSSAARVRRDPEPRPRRAAVGGEHRLGHRPSRHQVALPLRARDRERQADPPRPPGQQPVGKAEVAVGLGQDRAACGSASPPAPPARRRSRRRPSPRRRAAGAAPRAPRRPRRAPRPPPARRAAGCGGRSRAPAGSRSRSRRRAPAPPRSGRGCRGS